ncbi:MAG: uncharacterized protein K0S55_2097, partial [Clostridia bacterium]|nr:uncharacterized protein [Clostridia bacterium]
MKKMSVIILIFMILTLFTNYTIFAEQEITDQEVNETETPLTHEQIYTPTKADPPPTLISEAACLLDAKTGQVLYSKNMDKKLYPASITKIMTVLLALEIGDPTAIAVMSDKAIDTVPRDTSHIALTYGEEMSLENLIYAAMMPSANDACNGIAELICGEDGLTEFPMLMTEKAKELGTKNTNFANANGLPDDNHYTTAYDMAVITSYALKNPDFRNIFGKVTYTIPATNKNDERVLATGNYMLKENKYKYEGAVGGKTGFTKLAEYTCVTVANKNGRELIAVVLKSPNINDKYLDTTALFNYGFDNFREVTIKTDRVQKAIVKVIKDGYITANAAVKLKDDIKVLLHNGINETDITVTDDIPESFSGEVSNVFAHVSLPAETTLMYPQIGDYALETSITVLDNAFPVNSDNVENQPEVAENEEPAEQSPDSSPNGIVIALQTIGIFLGIVILIVLVIFIMFIYSNVRRRRRAHRRRMETIQKQSSDVKALSFEPARMT